MSPRRIFITGGTGSLGSALTKHFIENTDDVVVVYSRDPHKQNALAQSLGNHSRLRMTIGDVRDQDRLYWTMRGCDTVVHMAALKHVDTGEYNPTEYTRTNIDGTLNVAQVALDVGIEMALFISSDKSVAAINLYGRTKAVSERLWIRENIFGRGITKFSVLRYGNVFDSRGSVMEQWKDKKHGDQVTVRVPNPTRFVCFLSWGVQWVNKALEIMRGGEIFVPADLQAVSMLSVAEELVGWEYVNMLPLLTGEKQHEVLIAPEEYDSTVRVGDFYVINPDDPQWAYEAWKGGYAERGMYQSDLVETISARDFLELYRKETGK